MANLGRGLSYALGISSELSGAALAWNFGRWLLSQAMNALVK